MNPFAALGEAMQTVGCWLMNLVCRVIGHRWEVMSTYYPGAGTNYEGDFCRRCWRVEYRSAA